MKKTVLILALSLLSTMAWAHPVSFKKGIGFMSYNSPTMNEVLLAYSFNSQFAVGSTYLRDADSEFYIPRANYLVKRWNNEDSQANIYLSGGAGYENFNSKSYGVRLGEFVIDWEDRKYYTSLQHLYLNRDNDKNTLLPKNYNHTKARVGFAPFLADYNDLNVWLILQGEKHNNEKQIELTQFLRFYMKNVLWEVGAGSKGTFAFNFMIHM